MPRFPNFRTLPLPALTQLSVGSARPCSPLTATTPSGTATMSQTSPSSHLQTNSTPRISLTGGTSLSDLPVEIRLSIYSYLFSPSKVMLEASEPLPTQSCLIPAALNVRKRQYQRSSQLLRVCRQILYEARPVLYANTTFHIMIRTFAGSLPASLSNGHPIAKHIRHAVWQLDCDILKRFLDEDFAFQQGDLGMIDTLEIIARVDTWKGSFCGEDCDRDGFIQGRKSMLGYGQLLQAQLKNDSGSPVSFIEDQRFLGKGEVRIRLGKGQAENSYFGS